MGNTIKESYDSSSEFDLENQSYVVPNSKREGWTEIRRSTRTKDNELIETYDKDVQTLYQNFRYGSKKYPNNRCLGYRSVDDKGVAGDFVWQSYLQVENRISEFGSGLLSCSEITKLEKGSHVGIYSKNRPEWVIAEQACYAQSMIPISLYDTLGPEAVAFIINQAEISTIISEKVNIPKLIKAKDSCPSMKLIIQIEKEGDPQLTNQAKEKGLTIINFGEVESKGSFYKNQDNPPSSRDDVATIMYTSGTTGDPKGVMLSHGNILSMISSGIELGIKLRPDDVHISYLPLAHIFERAVQTILFMAGGCVGFFQGDIPKLFEDIALLKPTIFPSVPRLFNKLHDKAMAKVEKDGGISKLIFNMGINSKKGNLDNGGEPKSMLWDSIVFSKFRERLGGRVRMLVTGSAPISKEIHQFLQVCFSCPVLQGYGLTETAAGGTITLPWDFKTGNVGPPLTCNEIALQDVTELNYLSTNEIPQGEICIRGKNVFKGYYKQPEKTREVVDEDGWFHTGDIGQWNPNGTLSIIDRKKNIFKLSQGEYVAPEYIESIYIKNKFIEQIFIYGDSLQSSLVAVIVPDREVLEEWAKSNNLGNTEFKVLCQDEKIINMISQDSVKTAKEFKLKGYEIARAIYLDSEPFSEVNGLLTPTFKPKRPQLKDFYQDKIEKLYEKVMEDEKILAQKEEGN